MVAVKSDKKADVSSTGKKIAAKRAKKRATYTVDNRPKYAEMVVRAAAQLGGRTGASRQALKKWIVEEYALVADKAFNTRVTQALHKAMEDGLVIQLEGKQKFKVVKNELIAPPNKTARQVAVEKKSKSTTSKKSATSSKKTTVTKKRTTTTTAAKPKADPVKAAASKPAKPATRQTRTARAAAAAAKKAESSEAKKTKGKGGH